MVEHGEHIKTAPQGKKYALKVDSRVAALCTRLGAGNGQRRNPQVARHVSDQRVFNFTHGKPPPSCFFLKGVEVIADKNSL